MWRYANEKIHIAILLGDLLEKNGGDPRVHLFVDNTAAKALFTIGYSRKLALYSRALRGRLSFIFGCIRDGIMTAGYVPSEENRADLGTKVLTRIAFHNALAMNYIVPKGTRAQPSYQSATAPTKLVATIIASETSRISQYSSLRQRIGDKEESVIFSGDSGEDYQNSRLVFDPSASCAMRVDNGCLAISPSDEVVSCDGDLSGCIYICSDTREEVPLVCSLVHNVVPLSGPCSSESWTEKNVIGGLSCVGFIDPCFVSPEE